MKEIRLNRWSEHVIDLFLWALLFIFPILLSPGRGGIDWHRVSRELIRFIPFLLLFLLNNFLLFRILNRSGYAVYILVAGFSILAFSALGSFSWAPSEPPVPPGTPGGPGARDTMWFLNIFFYNCVISILVIGLNLAVKISFRWLEERKKYEQLQKENLQNQLTLLQRQISPHFFMNTLNNIHALVDQDQEVAKEAVVKLSHLMRVLLYENEHHTLVREVGFLQDYIELMRIRVNPSVEIIFEYPGNLPDVTFPPLLFLNFVENSFKHGISPFGQSYIHIRFTLEEGLLVARFSNSKTTPPSTAKAGIPVGMANSRQRLDLLYPGRYTFEIRETEKTFDILIKVPLYEHPLPGDR